TDEPAVPVKFSRVARAWALGSPTSKCFVIARLVRAIHFWSPTCGCMDHRDKPGGDDGWGEIVPRPRGSRLRWRFAPHHEVYWEALNAIPALPGYKQVGIKHARRNNLFDTRNVWRDVDLVLRQPFIGKIGLGVAFAAVADQGDDGAGFVVPRHFRGGPQ